MKTDRIVLAYGIENYSIEELSFLRTHGMMDSECIDAEIMRRTEEELLKKYKYWKGKGKDDRWKVHYYIDGKRHDKRCATKDEMISFLQELESQKKSSKPLSFGECYAKWFEEKSEEIDVNSVEKYESAYRRHIQGTAFEKMPINSISKEDIICFMIERIEHPTWRGKPSQQKLNRRTARELWYMIKDTFDYAEDADYIKLNVTSSVKKDIFFAHTKELERDSERIVISPEDDAALRSIFQKDHDEKPDYLPTYAVELIRLTGVRCGEIVCLRWSDFINIPNQGLHFCVQRRDSKNKKTKEMRYKNETKNKKIRYIPVTPEMQRLFDAVKDIEKKNGWESQWVFCDASGRLSVQKISSCIRNKCKQANILTRGCYTYRRTVNSRLRAKGLDAASASAILGNTVAVNNQYYTFDVRNGNDKRARLSDVYGELS